MMLYAFVKKDGNVECIGRECVNVPEELDAALQPYRVVGDNFHEMSTEEEFSAQLIHGTEEATRNKVAAEAAAAAAASATGAGTAAEAGTAAAAV